MKTIKIYVGCALTHAPEEFKKSIEIFKDALREIPHVEILEFVGLEVGTPIDVYEHDIHNCVAKCDILITECSYPALGLGWELGTSVEKRGIPVIAIAERNAVVTRLVQGAMCSRNPCYTFHRYDNILDVVPLVRHQVEELREMKSTV